MWVLLAIALGCLQLAEKLSRDVEFVLCTFRMMLSSRDEERSAGLFHEVPTQTRRSFAAMNMTSQLKH